MTTETKVEIQPSDINTNQHFFDAFGHMETEISAGYIVGLLQQKGQGWVPFTRPEIEAFYLEKRYPSKAHVEDFYRQVLNQHTGDLFMFNRLIVNGWVVKEGDLFSVTPEFIKRCYKASPARKNG